MATCEWCGFAVTVVIEGSTDATGEPVIHTRPQASPLTRSQVAGLPSGVADDLLEAARCVSCAAYRGAVLMARRAVEQAVVLHRIPPDRQTFRQKMGWLLGEGHLPPDTRRLARTLSDVANAATHGGSAISEEEARAGIRAAYEVVGILLVVEPTT